MRHTSGNKFIYPFARAGEPRPARCVSIDHHLFTVSAWRRDNCLQSLYEQMDFSHHPLRWRATKIAWPAVTSAFTAGRRWISHWRPARASFHLAGIPATKSAGGQIRGSDDCRSPVNQIAAEAEEAAKSHAWDLMLLASRKWTIVSSELAARGSANRAVDERINARICFALI